MGNRLIRFRKKLRNPNLCAKGEGFGKEKLDCCALEALENQDFILLWP